MKLDSMTEPFELVTGRTGSPRDWVRVMTLSLVVTWSFLLQGCLAGAWVALVAFDSMRSSHVTFGPFEQSYVAPPDQSSDAGHNSKVTSVAVLPVEGDPEMGARLATLLQQETTLRVESPATVAAGVTAADPRSAKADDADRGALAKEVTRALGVDTVLVGRVAGSPSHPSDWGWKAVEASVQIEFAHHVMQHVKELHLDELGYLPKKIS